MGVHGSKPQKQAQVLMLGLDGAGKTALLYKLKDNARVVTVPTVGFNVEMLETKKKKEGPGLTVWDIGGQKRMRPHWKHYYGEADALVFVLDSQDLRRLDEARKELHQVLKSQSLAKLPLVVLANKQDLRSALGVTELSLRMDLRRVCGGRAWYIQPCSAMTGMGLEEGFRRVAYLLKNPLEQAEEHIKDTVKLLKPIGAGIMAAKPGLECG